MDVILLEKVENLGNIGDRVKVRSGYGRNFLLPRGKATLATPSNVAVFEARRAEFEKKEAEELEAARARAATAATLTLRLSAKAGTEGKLFGSLGTADIAEACTAAGVPVKRSEVRLPDGPIRTLGDHSIELHLHSDVNAVIRITVVGEDDAGRAN
jgi:large subunit ribosomal protein L9